MNDQPYKGKRVLVTGADGFMGSHLTEALLDQGANVSIFVRGSSVTGTHQFQMRNLAHRKDELSAIIAGDVGSKDTIALIRDNAPEVIFHLAADAYVPKSFDQPLEVHRTNVDGTLNVMLAARECRANRIVVCSSSEVYGHCAGSIDENTALRPTSPYGASKLAADRYAFSFYTTYNLPVAIIRPFNTYGPRHTYDVIPKFIDLALQGKDITVYGDGTQTRDLMYVDDTVRGFLLMGHHEKALGAVVNFGTGKDTTVNKVAQMIKKYIDTPSKIVHVEKRMAEVQKMRCNPTLAKELFSWEASLDIEEGIKRNIEYVREHSNHKETVLV